MALKISLKYAVLFGASNTTIFASPGAIDMAIWDVVAKIDRKPLYLMLAERYGTGSANSEVWVYAAGGYYQPGKGILFRALYL